MGNEFLQARELLSRVLAWEEPMQSFVNIHTTVTKDGKKFWGGRAVKSLDEAENFLTWTVSNSDDIYFCLSTQANAKPRTDKIGRTYYIAERNQQNVVALKSLFIDVDFKLYDSPASATKELAKFIKNTGMPKPTAIVNSGGGLHIYWALDHALTRNEWQPLADALAEAAKQQNFKCDTACTIDSARILRLPQTTNKKYNPPRPVTLVGSTVEHDYATDNISKILDPYKIKRSTPAQSNTIFMDPALFPPRPPLPYKSNLAAGITETIYEPIKLEDVLPECPWLAEAVATGGKDYANPLWNLTTLCATFTVGGEADAHRMANGHADYEPASTEALFARKAREQQQKGLGWPSCRTISASGATPCSSCPHLVEGKSPFHFVKKPEPPLKELIPEEGIIDEDVPEGYERTDNGYINYFFTDDEGLTQKVEVVDAPLEDGWIESTADGELLHFSSRQRKTGAKVHIELPLMFMGMVKEMKQAIQKKGVLLPEENKDFKRFSKFMSAWVKKLQVLKDSVKVESFGWHTGDAGVDGFVYGGRKWTAAGSSPAGTADPVLEGIYHPVGDLQRWKDAAKLITEQHRPELNAIIAAAFGGPLIRFHNTAAALLSVTSTESGVGKSTALNIATGVWGKPSIAKQGLTDTVNQVMGKLSRTRHLPAFYDEIHDEKDFKKIADITWQFIESKERGRLRSNASLQKIGEWDTLLTAASNGSVTSAVVENSQSTTAGYYRVFEYEVRRTPPGAPGMVSPGEASRIGGYLKDNYGTAGMEYTKFLGANPDKVRQDFGVYYDRVTSEINMLQEERFWAALITCLLLGTNYANNLGLTEIDEAGLQHFLYTQVDRLRGRKDRESIDLTMADNVSDILARYISENHATGTIKTNRIPITAGRPLPDAIKILYPQPISQIRDLVIQIGMEDNRMRISSSHLRKWLREHKRQPKPVIDALMNQFGMKEIKGKLAGGTGHALPTEYLFELNLTGSSLIDFINEQI